MSDYPLLQAHHGSSASLNDRAVLRDLNSGTSRGAKQHAFAAEVRSSSGSLGPGMQGKMPPVWPATGGTALPGAALALQTVADLKRQSRQLLKARSSSRTLQQLQHLAQLKHPPSTASVAEPAAMLQNAIILEQLINSWSRAGGRGQVSCYEQQQDAGHSDVAAADSQAAQQEQQQQLHSTIAALQEEMAAMTAKHRAAQEENRALYNTVQDLRGDIRVFCRVRPLHCTDSHLPACVDVGSEGELALYDPEQHGRKEFHFGRVFDTASSQADVYADVQPLAQSVLDGYNVCIFAYGQTGSGKTHTMSGSTTHDAEGRGINYRVLDDVFALRDARKHEVQYDIRVQMLEVYNDTLLDLLALPPSSLRGCPPPEALKILSTQASGCNVQGACQVEVHTTDDVLALMVHGAQSRTVGETALNARSSRSHEVLTILVDGLTIATGARSHGCLHLVDLAGSERVAKSGATGERLVETRHINKSLSALGNVMSALASKKACHVPFRDSKLTQLLQDSLSGQAKVLMLVHISPEADSFGETLSTLKFGERVAEINLGQAKKNVESGRVFHAREAAARLQQQAEWQQEEMRGLQQQVQELQEELAAARHHAATPAGSGPLSPADRELETLRFVHSEVQGELERARIALREARSRVGELSNQLVASQARPLGGSSCSRSDDSSPPSLGPWLEHRGSPTPTLSGWAPLRPSLQRLPRASTCPPLERCGSPTVRANLASSFDSPQQQPTTPSVARLRIQASVDRHRERLQAARLSINGPATPRHTAAPASRSKKKPTARQL